HRRRPQSATCRGRLSRRPHFDEGTDRLCSAQHFIVAEYRRFALLTADCGLRIADLRLGAVSDAQNPQSAIRNPQFSRAFFIDRDGTLNEDIGYVSTPDELVLYPWAAEAVRLVNESEFKAIVITNQSAIARGMYSEQTLGAFH